MRRRGICTAVVATATGRTTGRRRGWVHSLIVEVPGHTAPRPTRGRCVRRHASTPATTTSDRRRRHGRAVGVAGAGRPVFLCALLGELAARMTHAVGRRANRCGAISTWLGFDGRGYIFAQGVCAPRGAAVGLSSGRTKIERRPSNSQAAAPSEKLARRCQISALCRRLCRETQDADDDCARHDCQSGRHP